MNVTADFLVQAILVATMGVVFLFVGIRTLLADRHLYNGVRRRTGTARRAAIGAVDHQDGDGDATTVAGMAIGLHHGRRVIVRNGKIASDSISAC
jgi:hypothetical protein